MKKHLFGSEFIFVIFPQFHRRAIVQFVRCFHTKHNNFINNIWVPPLFVGIVNRFSHSNRSTKASHIHSSILLSFTSGDDGWEFPHI